MSNSDFNDEDIPMAQLAIATPSTAKTFGTLNVVFASLLLMYAVCSGVSLAANFVMQPLMAKTINDVKIAEERRQKQLVDELEKEEKAAKTPEEKAAVRNRITTLQAQQVPMPDMSKMFGFNQGGFLVFGLVDMISGFLLNLFMLASGIGLLRLAEWGRVMGVWVALSKCIRLVLVQGYNLMVIVPAAAKQMGDIFTDIQKAAPPGAARPGPDFSQMAAWMGAAMGVAALVVLVAGLIYPALCLWFLTRPGVKAACQVR